MDKKSAPNYNVEVTTPAPSVFESASLLQPFLLPAGATGLGALLLAKQLQKGKEAAKLTEIALKNKKGLKAVKRLAKTKGIASPSALATLLGLPALGAGGTALYNRLTGEPGKYLGYLMDSIFSKKKK